jgi:hypothetical protein
MAHDSVFGHALGQWFGTHQGIQRTYERLSAVYSAPRLKKLWAEHVKRCSECQKRYTKENEQVSVATDQNKWDAI